VDASKPMNINQEKLKRGQTREDGLIFWAYSNGYENWISLSEFNAKREKARIDMIEWRKLNPSKSRDGAKKWRKQNPEKAKNSYAIWKKNNPDKFKEKTQKWRLRNRVKLNELAKAKYQKAKALNPEKFREKSRVSAARWRIKNPEKAKERSRTWQIENRAKTVDYTQKREALKKAAMPDDFWPEAVLGLYRSAERITRCTGIKHEVDHIWPLSKGGSHCHRNLQVIPSKLNQRKSARMDYRLLSPYRNEGMQKGLSLV